MQLVGGNAGKFAARSMLTLESALASTQAHAVGVNWYWGK
jgi:hypothetical protein